MVMKIQYMLKTENLKANGLVEVIVVIAILAITMLTVVSVSTKSFRRIKQDEVLDKASNIQFRALEYAKSANQISGIDSMQDGDTKNFRLNFVDGEMILEEAFLSDDLILQNCSRDSQYFVDLSDNDTDIFCNQIKVDALLNNDKLVYKITSRVVYWNLDHFEENELIGFRQKIYIPGNYNNGNGNGDSQPFF